MADADDIFAMGHMAMEQATRIRELEAEVASLREELRLAYAGGEEEAKRGDRLFEDNRALLLLIFSKTRLCPFGSGRDGLRNACERGSPGCMCDDWVAEHRTALAQAEQPDDEPTDTGQYEDGGCQFAPEAEELPEEPSAEEMLDHIEHKHGDCFKKYCDLAPHVKGEKTLREAIRDAMAKDRLDALAKGKEGG